MLNAPLSDAAGFVGPTSDFLKTEILRVGAPAADVRSAFAFVASETALDPRAYDALSPRMRRLVDLVAVAGIGLSTSICDMPDSDPAA